MKLSSLFRSSLKLFIFLFFTISLSGCLDAGLKRAAHKRAQEKAIEEEQAPLPEETQTSQETQEENNQETAAEDKAPVNREEVEAKIEELFAAMEESLKNETPCDSPESSCESGKQNSQDPDLISCENIDTSSCDDNASLVCARIRVQIEESQSEEWLELKNACVACQNRVQELGNTKLEILGFKLGQCEEAS